MSNPFSWFRRKQKALLAVFGVLIIFTFVVGGVVMDWLQRRGGPRGGSAPVVSWKHDDIDEAQLTSMRNMHNWTVRFLDMLIAETFRKGGEPKGPGIRRNQQRQIVDPGIPRSGQEEDVVRTMVLARKAEDMGMVITEDAIFEFLHLLSDDKVRRSDFGDILSRATGGNVARDQLFKQLRTEMLAQNLQRVVGSGLMAMPPESAWDYYNRFSRRIKAEVLPLKVDDYVSQVKSQPTEDGAGIGPGNGARTVTTTVNYGGSPLDSAKVHYKKGTKSFLQTTNPNGQCTHNLDDGKWAVEITLSGYSFTQTTLTVNGNETQTYSMTLLPEVKQLYEDGKDRYPDPTSPEPGFKRRKEIAFAYLKIEDERFLEKAKAEVSEEDIKKHYEENKDDFKVPELPPAEEEKPKAKPEAKPDEDPEAKPKAKSADSDAEDDVPNKEESPKSPATDENTERAPTAKDGPSEGEESGAPAEPKPATEAAKPKETEEKTRKPSAETDVSAPDVDLAPPENETGDAKAPDTSDGTRVGGGEETLFVSFNAAAKSDAAEDSAKDEPPEKKPAGAPADSTAKEPGAKVDSTTETKAPSAPKGQSDGADVAAPDKKDAPAGEASEKEKPVEYQPIEQVEDHIRGIIALPIADKRKKKALDDAKRDIDLYYSQRIKWQAAVDSDLEMDEPSRFDHEKFAEENNLTAGETPLLDEIEIGDYELGKGWVNASGQRFKFAQIAYADGIPLFRAREISPDEYGVDFLYWKIEEEDWRNEDGELEDVPELKEIRDEVVEEWYRREALELARAKAEELAKKAKGDKPLKEALGEERSKEVVETDEFTWMSWGASPTGFGLPGISSVIGVDDSGREFKEEACGMEFMESVYALEVGENGVAVNQPQTVVYVVRILSETPDEDQRKREFLQTGSMYAMFLHMTTVQEAMEDWYEDLEKEMEVEWHRSPEIFTQR